MNREATIWFLFDALLFRIWFNLNHFLHLIPSLPLLCVLWASAVKKILSQFVAASS
jgi:hypothetical protein